MNCIYVDSNVRMAMAKYAQKKPSPYKYSAKCYKNIVMQSF